MSQFRDFNLKLLVIEELMYGPEPLLPVYDLPARLAERGIGDPASYVLENGLHAEVLPESRAHFEALEIPAELLARVEELCFDAGADVFRHCAPAWDGEDDLFDVRSLDDLALLPNLREVTFVEDGVRHRHRLSPGTRSSPAAPAGPSGAPPGKATHRRHAEVTLPSFLPFLTMLRTGDPVGVHRLPGVGAAQVGGVAESTVGLRVAAVLSFYRYHADVHGLAVAGRLYRVGGRRARSRYVGALAHLDRRSEYVSSAVRVRTRGRGPAPVLTPAQAEAILDRCARFDVVAVRWSGSVSDRLLFAMLSETGMRLGECLSLKHCDWHVGRGGTPFVEVVPRQDHPAGVRVKNSRFRRIYISDDLERLHSEYVGELCDADAHRAVNLENWWVFVNLRRGEWLAPLRPETVYDLVDGLKRRLGKAVPPAWTPHWWRHTHATVLLLSGAHEHVVMRRMGHADVQSALTLYGWVTEDAELKTLANWKSSTTNWRGMEGSSA